MTAHRTGQDGRRRGIAYVLALLLLSLLCTLAAGVTVMTDLSLQQSENSRRATEAQLAAESGMSFAVATLKTCQSEPTLLELPDMLDVVHAHLTASLAGHGVTLYEENPEDPTSFRKVSVPTITTVGGQQFSFEVFVAEYDPEDGVTPTKLQLIVEGYSGDLVRTLGMRFDVELNKELLHYAFVSSVRIIARGTIHINGPISSSWKRQLIPIENDPSESYRNHTVYPLDIDIKTGAVIDGSLGTTQSASDFIGDPDKGDYDFRNGIKRNGSKDNEMVADMSYSEPPVKHLTTQDFDTSPLKEMTSTDNLPAEDASNVSLGMWGLRGKKWQNHNGEDKPALHNICIPKGTNPYFKGCTFTGITYIEVDEDTDNPNSGNQNGVVFEDCTFEGPIITGVPKKMRWDYNSMEFRGLTQFHTSMIQSALGGVTLMAPNYNVNIGGSEGGGGSGDSDVCGLVIGGVVDLYNDISVNGTVISMAEIVDENGNIIMGQNVSWLTAGNVCGANIGNLNGSSDNVHITPDPDNVIPLGIKKRYELIANIDSYAEAGS